MFTINSLFANIAFTKCILIQNFFSWVLFVYIFLDFAAHVIKIMY